MNANSGSVWCWSSNTKLIASSHTDTILPSPLSPCRPVSFLMADQFLLLLHPNLAARPTPVEGKHRSQRWAQLCCRDVPPFPQTRSGSRPREDGTGSGRTRTSPRVLPGRAIASPRKATRIRGQQGAFIFPPLHPNITLEI